MNKQEAIALMKQGAKITHRLFARNEWIRDVPLVNVTNRIIDEEGFTQTYDEFFETRTSHRWDDGYSVWEPLDEPMTGVDLGRGDMLVFGTGMMEVDTVSGEVTHIGQEQIRPEADEWTQVEDELPEMFNLYDFTGADIMVSSVVVTNKGAAALLDGEWVVASWDVSEACKRLEGVTRWKPIHYSGEGES
jgi:hypothetical protein